MHILLRAPTESKDYALTALCIPVLARRPSPCRPAGARRDRDRRRESAGAGAPLERDRPRAAACCSAGPAVGVDHHGEPAHHAAAQHVAEILDRAAWAMPSRRSRAWLAAARGWHRRTPAGWTAGRRYPRWKSSRRARRCRSRPCARRRCRFRAAGRVLRRGRSGCRSRHAWRAG